jgi:hypothetical protein
MVWTAASILWRLPGMEGDIDSPTLKAALIPQRFPGVEVGLDSPAIPKR